MILISLSVKAAFAVKLSSAVLAHGNIAQAALTAAYAMRDAVRFARLVSDTMTCTPCAPLRGCEYRADSPLCYQNPADARPCLLDDFNPVSMPPPVARAGSGRN
jgi:hypothetical protein